MAPWEARERNRVHRLSPPNANATDARAQPVADRPRTGTTVTTVTDVLISMNMPADVHACCWIAHSTGAVDRAITPACQPVRPRNQPMRALEYSL